MSNPNIQELDDYESQQGASVPKAPANWEQLTNWKDWSPTKIAETAEQAWAEHLSGSEEPTNEPIVAETEGIHRGYSPKDLARTILRREAGLGPAKRKPSRHLLRDGFYDEELGTVLGRVHNMLPPGFERSHTVQTHTNPSQLDLPRVSSKPSGTELDTSYLKAISTFYDAPMSTVMLLAEKFGEDATEAIFRRVSGTGTKPEMISQLTSLFTHAVEAPCESFYLISVGASNYLSQEAAKLGDHDGDLLHNPTFVDDAVGNHPCLSVVRLGSDLSAIVGSNCIGCIAPDHAHVDAGYSQGRDSIPYERLGETLRIEETGQIVTPTGRDSVTGARDYFEHQTVQALDAKGDNGNI